MQSFIKVIAYVDARIFSVILLVIEHFQKVQVSIVYDKYMTGHTFA